jgi:nitrate/nitrite transport system permease protein
VWDEFQNGSSQSLARIMFAVIVIGLIGFLLDRMMMLLQSLSSRNHRL